MRMHSVLFAISIAGISFAQDPAQFGAPFAGVPDPRDASIYQVNIRSFSASRKFQAVTDRLDSIKSLGVNVVYLMPVFPVGIVNSINSPYGPRDYYAVNAEFGTLADLRKLVDEAHKRKLSVILDWVGNHTAWDHAWIKEHPSWYLHDASGAIVSPPGFHSAQLDFRNADMRAAMIAAMRYWVFAANCDGFRFDYVAGPPLDFWQAACASLRSISTHRLILLAEGGGTQYFSHFDYTFGFSFYDQLKAIFGKGASAAKLDALNASTYLNASEMNQVVRYTTNHDVNSADGTPLALFGGHAGSMAAFAVAALMKGVPMIYSGQEVETPYQLKFPFTGKPIDWSLNPGAPAGYARIISIRNASDAIRRGSPSGFGNADVCAFYKSHGSDKSLVVINLRNAAGAVAIPDSLARMQWYDAVSRKPVTLPATMALSAYEYRAFSNARPSPLGPGRTGHKTRVTASWSVQRPPGTVRLERLRENGRIESRSIKGEEYR